MGEQWKKAAGNFYSQLLSIDGGSSGKLYLNLFKPKRMWALFNEVVMFQYLKNI